MKKTLNIIKKILTIIIIIIWAALLFNLKLQTELYVVSVVLLWLVFFINPMIEYITGKSEEEPSSPTVIFFILFGGFFSFALTFVLYDIIFSDNIKAGSNYNLYGQVVSAFIIYLLLTGIYRMVREIMKQPEQDRHLRKYASIILRYLLIFIFSFVLPLYQFYDQRCEISLSSLNTPARLEAEVISEPLTTKNIFESRTKGIIEDKGLIEEFMAEIRTLKLENVRNLDKLNYVFMQERNYPFLEVHAYYGSNNPVRLDDMDSGFLGSIEIYDNGQVFLKSYNENREFFKTDSFRYFRIPLSDSMLKRLLQALHIEY